MSSRTYEELQPISVYSLRNPEPTLTYQESRSLLPAALLQSITMTSQDCSLLDVPDWVSALANDHLASLHLLFLRAEQKRSQVQAIQTHRSQGTFPATLCLTMDVSVGRSMPISTEALFSAESLACREQERILMKIATARLELSHSMASTMRMMSRAAESRGRPAPSEDDIEVYCKWFAGKLDVAIQRERAQLKRNTSGPRRLQRRLNTPSRSCAIIRAGQESDDSSLGG